MKNIEIFDRVLSVNKEYVEAIEAGASAGIQEALLMACDIAYRELILENGLAQEYRDYCDMRIAKRGSVL